MSVQNQYNLTMQGATAGVVEKHLYSKSFPANDNLEFGRFVRIRNNGTIAPAGADVIRTTSNITSGTITLTIVKKNLETGSSSTNNLTVPFATDNNTTYANLSTAISGLGDVNATVISESGNSRGISLEPVGDFEFYITALSMPVNYTIDYNRLGGVLVYKNNEAGVLKRTESGEVLLQGVIAVSSVDSDINYNDNLYIIGIGAIDDLGKITKIKNPENYLLGKNLIDNNNGIAIIKVNV
jgi:hypothetical protein